MKIGQSFVSAIGLGTAAFAFRDVTEAESIRTVHAALDAGISLIDTAIAYSRPGFASYAESLLHKAIATSNAQNVMVATKGGHWRDGEEFPVDASPAALRRNCELSLTTLGVERIDLYQLHHVDPKVPLMESVGALADLQHEGKIDLIGLSNVSAAEIDLARSIASIASVQNRASFAHPSGLAVAEHCAALDIAFLAYMPLEGTGHTVNTRAQPLLAIASERGVSPQQVRLAWLIAQRDNILPLVGATRPETIQDSAAAAALELTRDELLTLSSKSYMLALGDDAPIQHS